MKPKTISNINTLTLKKETIANLNQLEMTRAKGGGTAYSGNEYDTTCITTCDMTCSGCPYEME